MIDIKWWHEVVQKDWIQGAAWTRIFSEAISSEISGTPTPEQFTQITQLTTLECRGNEIPTVEIQAVKNLFPKCKVIS